MCIASFEVCIFFCDSEAIATQNLAPEAITRARNYEKLSETDAGRFAIDGQDLSGLRMSYPIPREIDLRTAKHFAGAPDKPTLRKRLNNGVLDIFDDSDIVYVAVEMLVDPLMPLWDAGTPGTWSHQLIGSRFTSPPSFQSNPPGCVTATPATNTPPITPFCCAIHAGQLLRATRFYPPLQNICYPAG